MAQCSFSGAGRQCGTSVDEPGNVGCVSIADCRRKIKGHLATIKVTDASLTTEAQLLFARIGTI